MKSASVKEKFESAIYSLVTGKGNARECIWQSYLEIKNLRDEDIPYPIKGKWQLLQERLAMQINGMNTSKMQFFLQKKALGECVEIAEMINELNNAIDHRARPLPV